MDLVAQMVMLFLNWTSSFQGRRRGLFIGPLELEPLGATYTGQSGKYKPDSPAQPDTPVDTRRILRPGKVSGLCPHRVREESDEAV